MEKDENVLYIAEILYESGKVHFRYSRKKSEDGKQWIREGHFIEYYENGNVGSEGLYDEGLETGLWADYHTNGVKAAEGHYRSGVEVGVWNYWDEEGNPEESEDFGD